MDHMSTAHCKIQMSPRLLRRCEQIRENCEHGTSVRTTAFAILQIMAGNWPRFARIESRRERMVAIAWLEINAWWQCDCTTHWFKFVDAR